MPREKLYQHGASVLSDEELLALIISTGTRTDQQSKSATVLAIELLTTFGSLRELASRDILDYTGQDGIGPAKSARLAASFELGRRHPRGARAAGATFRCSQKVLN